MKSKDDVEKLEKLIAQLQSLHVEISQLAKKSPNDGLNKFKLKFVNTVLKAANELLTTGYLPFEGFSQFEEDSLPTNSDVTMILAQYMDQTERFRSAQMTSAGEFAGYVYLIDGKPSDIKGRSPTRVGVPRK
jgi:hypothetical protein